ncbi:MAG: hypothetical protein AAF378_17695 [Cyanobacteria bacterium P01_A01_bin.84]
MSYQLCDRDRKGQKKKDSSSVNALDSRRLLRRPFIVQQKKQCSTSHNLGISFSQAERYGHHFSKIQPDGGFINTPIQMFSVLEEERQKYVSGLVSGSNLDLNKSLLTNSSPNKLSKTDNEKPPSKFLDVSKSNINPNNILSTLNIKKDINRNLVDKNQSDRSINNNISNYDKTVYKGYKYSDKTGNKYHEISELNSYRNNSQDSYQNNSKQKEDKDSKNKKNNKIDDNNNIKISENNHAPKQKDLEVKDKSEDPKVKAKVNEKNSKENSQEKNNFVAPPPIYENDKNTPAPKAKTRNGYIAKREAINTLDNNNMFTVTQRAVKKISQDNVNKSEARKANDNQQQIKIKNSAELVRDRVIDDDREVKEHLRDNWNLDPDAVQEEGGEELILQKTQL